MESAGAQFDEVIKSNFAAQVIKSSVAGAQIFIFLYILDRFLRAPPSIRETRLVYVGVSFLLTVLSCGSSTVGSIAVFDVLFNSPSRMPTERLALWTQVHHRLGLVADLLADLSIWLADALLVYRCYVICFDCARLAAIPLVIYITNIGLSIKGYSILWGNEDNRFKAASIFLIAINNIILTLLMSWRLLRGHRQLSESLPMAKHKLYTGAISVLVESAAPVALCGLALGIVTAIQEHMDTGFAQTVFTILFHISIPLCPQIIMFRIASGRSHATRSEITLTEIRFQSRSIESTP